MKKVKISFDCGTAYLEENTYYFISGKAVEEAKEIAKIIEEDDEDRLDEIIEDYYGLPDYLEELAMNGPSPEGIDHLSETSVEMYSYKFDLVKVEVDGEIVFEEENWTLDRDEDTVECESSLKPAYDIINKKGMDELDAIHFKEGDTSSVLAEFCFDIEDVFDISKFHFVRTKSGFNPTNAFYDGQQIYGEIVNDFCLDHRDTYLVVLSKDGAKEFDLDSF